MLLWLAAAHAACPEPTDIAGLNRWANEVELAFSARDKGRMTTAADSAKAELTCIDERLAPADIATFLRAQGVAAFIERERSEAASLFETARELDPDFAFDAELLSESHPLRGLYESIPAGAAAVTNPLDDPAEGWLSVNGTVAKTVPVGRAYVLQRFDPAGAVLDTWLVGVGSPVPDYPTASEAPVEQPRSGDGSSVVVGGGILLVPNDTDSQVFGAAAVTVLVPIFDSVAFDLHVGNGIAAYTNPDNERFTLNLPYARLGPRFWVGAPDAELRPYLGIGYLSALHRPEASETLKYVPGGAANAGIRTLLSESVVLDIDAQVGVTAQFDPNRSGPGLQAGVLLGLGYRF